MTLNQSAFLALIRYSEGTDRSPNPYSVTYGYKYTITDFSDHPAILGTWHGETLPDHLCAAVGLPAGCVSTAAGAYQLIKPTWIRMKSKLGLTSFNAQSQDDAALGLIHSVGGIDLINQGRVQDAIQACRGIWASLPGNDAGQPQRTMADLMTAFTGAGGSLA